jgi:hypothetical protein
MTQETSRLAAAALLGALLAVGTGAAAATSAPPSTEPAAWQTHELEFQFYGFTTTYSCDGLEARLRLLLTRLGARPGFTVWTYGCARGGGIPDKFARARLNFASLQPAPTAAGGDAALAGAWKSVEFAPHRPSELDPGDCELLEQFRDRLLALFTTRAIQNQLTCVPHQVPGSFSLRLEVFALPGKT